MSLFRRSLRFERACRAGLIFALPIILDACGSATDAPVIAGGDEASGDADAGARPRVDASVQADAAPDPVHADGGASQGPLPEDGSAPPLTDAASPPPSADGSAQPPLADGSTPPPNGDGAPTRRACTSAFGGGLSTSHGRLDGYVVAVIPPGQGKQCNGDSTHVHLQVLFSGEVYDVAANVDGNEMERDGALLGEPWTEGWHTQASLDYVADLGVHSASFTLTGLSAVATELEQRLAQANHVSIYCTGYGATGCHLVHRQQGGHDGAIVLDPLSSSPHWLLFDFSTPTF